MKYPPSRVVIRELRKCKPSLDEFFIPRNFDVADVILKEVGAILENAEQSGLALTSTEILNLKVYHHVLQVSEYIWQGLIKSARQSLKQLHSCYKQLTQLDASNGMYLVVMVTVISISVSVCLCLFFEVSILPRQLILPLS